MRTLQQRADDVVSMLLDPELELSARERFSYYTNWCRYEFNLLLWQKYMRKTLRLAHQLDEDRMTFALRKDMSHL